MTWAEMHRVVLETTTHDFLVPTSAQTIRTTLDRFRRELSEENFTFFPCACCVRPFSAANLHDVVFPLRAPCLFLPGWSRTGGRSRIRTTWVRCGKRMWPHAST